ncbi:hypothetical protein BJ322DRAFT_1032122 [Thelephora terrestris]|uniref:Zn(2)-C6 fungal-type domain-containing protein n=1 Tax=Thelephora terrestris TaxID=56493 RepID=A0A9P6HQI8_9AGAM|nr:hypothetical protein BJ322DRAFT_1032122 [Thelephora terrestris]
MDSQAATSETSFVKESYRLFAYYHPQYQPDCPPPQEDQYASFILDEQELPVDPTYHPPTASFSSAFDPSVGYLVPSIPESLELDQFFTQLGAVPPGKVSTYSELMPHVVAHKTMAMLRQDARVATTPQPCVSPALCQGHADLPECADIDFDDELDCPGEPAADFYAESSDVEEDHDHSHPPPPPSPYSSPSPSPCSSRSSSFGSYDLHSVVRSGRGKNRYSPIEVKPPSRKGRSVTKRVSCGSDDEEPRKPRKRREAVSLACYFCRKRKIACRQPPADSPDRTCNQCKIRGIDCQYPTESRRGARRRSASTHEDHEH